ncbi:hypothetical protein [Kocuria salsicia]|nr:hypothetical protein [Kocuria salsicia]
MAVRSMLPALEQQHWNEIAADFEDRSFENEFVQIMNRTLGTPPPEGQ